jgi:hypothetical protein
MGKSYTSTVFILICIFSRNYGISAGVSKNISQPKIFPQSNKHLLATNTTSSMLVPFVMKYPLPFIPPRIDFLL